MSSTLTNVVSRYLKAQGFPRSTSQAAPGFRVATTNGRTVVTYTLGTANPQLTPERRRELVSASIQAMEQALSQRYTVIMWAPAEGTDYTLTVR